ncbi:glycoside hydrolase family 99-like domain-containing protein [Aeromonas caviae]|uniref:glycosyltransferase WbsX family protein n=1 Tax=Aeromonas caviae TaxID=648 RepID=UPI0013235B1E|nr:glycoside hydrolase family 99-like domain-containing protein [Aeromonas caviae]MXQ71182.1 hypothetical protein [Aeromonas caviae]
MNHLIAYYLPQYHRVKENDEWWGEGFTEWVALNNAKSYFPSQKIRMPTELGQYNLLDPTVLADQYSLASKYGVDAFCMWSYWFGDGDVLLDKPLRLILEHDISVKYCIAWANHSWYNKTKGLLLKEQKYLGERDYIKFYGYIRDHILSDNYYKIDGRPVFTIYDPKSIPDLSIFIATFNRLAKEDGFGGIYFIAESTSSTESYVNSFDAYLNSQEMYGFRSFYQKIKEKLVRKYRIKILGPIKYSYNDMVKYLGDRVLDEKEIPVIFSGWDTTIRHKKLGVYFDDFTLSNFSNHVRDVFTKKNKDGLTFIKSWNEWAEGNTIEPDSMFDKSLLDTIKKYK